MSKILSDSIAFNKEKLQEVAFEFNTVNSESVTPLQNISENLAKVSNTDNWSGPIADSARSDLKDAMQVVEDIEKNMKAINDLLNQAASNFTSIKYKEE